METENDYPLAQAPRNLHGRSSTRQRPRTVVRNCIPETGSAHRETDEARHARGDGEPTAHLGFIGAAAGHDAADLLTAATPRDLHNAFAIGVEAQALDFPHVGVDAGVLQCMQRLLHQQRSRLSIKGVVVTT